MKRDFHLGSLIREELDRQQRTVTWLAAQINCDRSNIYDIFDRRFINIEILTRISRALSRNVFKDLAEYMETVVKNPTQV